MTSLWSSTKTASCYDNCFLTSNLSSMQVNGLSNSYAAALTFLRVCGILWLMSKLLFFVADLSVLVSGMVDWLAIIKRSSPIIFVTSIADSILTTLLCNPCILYSPFPTFGIVLDKDVVEDLVIGTVLVILFLSCCKVADWLSLYFNVS